MGGIIESVFIPDEKNDTLCLSSQVGCALTCSFCHTGAQDKSSLRNLAVDEIVGQVVNAKNLFDDSDESGKPKFSDIFISKELGRRRERKYLPQSKIFSLTQRGTDMYL